MVAEGSHIGLANLPEITAESEGDVVEAEHMLAMSIAMIMLNVISLWVSGCTPSTSIGFPSVATIIIGFSWVGRERDASGMWSATEQPLL